MGKITDNNDGNDNSVSFPHKNKLIADKDFDKLKKLLALLSLKHDISPDNLAKIAWQEKQISIPATIYSNKKLSTLETTVKYLKEELKLRYSQIGKILNRNERTVWATYANSLKKHPKKLFVGKGILIPINILSNRKYSILESLVGFLKDGTGLRFFEISRLLKLDARTIWTCYMRLKKKREGENEAR
ncbi:hypothetical protein GOV08_05530 [Candidatus Woesearchaeota archaeon]|nr:hypothetical protein [Candidatus Woesearchaeota archaeon]